MVISYWTVTGFRDVSTTRGVPTPVHLDTITPVMTLTLFRYHSGGNYLNLYLLGISVKTQKEKDIKVTKGFDTCIPIDST